MLDLSEIPILETPRLRLRRPELPDFEAYAALCADPEVMRYIGDGLPQSRRRAWQALTGMLGHWALRGYGQFAVESKATGAFLGRVGLYHPDPWPGTELAWALARAHWGRGFAPEAAVAVREGFRHAAAPAPRQRDHSREPPLDPRRREDRRVFRPQR